MNNNRQRHYQKPLKLRKDRSKLLTESERKILPKRKCVLEVENLKFTCIEPEIITGKLPIIKVSHSKGTGRKRGRPRKELKNCENGVYSNLVNIWPQVIYNENYNKQNFNDNKVLYDGIIQNGGVKNVCLNKIQSIEDPSRINICSQPTICIPINSNSYAPTFFQNNNNNVQIIQHQNKIKFTHNGTIPSTCIEPNYQVSQTSNCTYQVPLNKNYNDHNNYELINASVHINEFNQYPQKPLNNNMVASNYSNQYVPADIYKNG